MSPLAKTLMLTIVIVAILLRPIAGQTFGVNVNVATINSLTNYTFNIIDPSLNLSSTVSGTITFTFTTGKYNLNPPSTYPCTEITSGVSFTCTATSNTLSLPYPGSFTRNPSFNLQVQNIKNPSNTAPTSVTYTFTYSNATIARTMQKTLNIYQPTSLTSCAVTFTPSTTLTLGKANFAVTIHSVVESGGSIQLTFPANWNSPPNTKNYTPIGSLGSSSPTFSLILNNGFLSSSPSLANSATQISLGSVFIQPAPSGTSLSFAVDNIMSPPTTSALNYVTVTTMSADNSGSID